MDKKNDNKNDKTENEPPLRYLNDRIPKSENVWMSRMADKYQNRPDTPEFAAMCVAEFAFIYRMGYGTQRGGSRVLPLQNDIISAQHACLIFNSLDNIFISDRQHCAHSGVLQTNYSHHDTVFSILT